MEFCSGGDLEKILNKTKCLSQTVYFFFIISFILFFSIYLGATKINETYINRFKKIT
jgi:hypothetical protein